MIAAPATCVPHAAHDDDSCNRHDDRDDTGRSFCLTVVGDNLRLGAATNAVRIASCWYPSEDPDLQAGAVST